MCNVINTPLFPVCCLLLTAALAAGGETPGEGVVRFDFETGDLQGWQVVEGKFDRLVSDRDTYHNPPHAKYNKQGKYYLSTVEQQPGMPSNDKMTGVVESPVFVLSAPEMSFLVGGGDFEDTYVALCTLDGKEVLKARGKRTEEMQRTQWQAPQLVGQRVFLRVVDHNTGSWGHVTFDDFTAKGTLDAAATQKHFAALRSREARQEFGARLAALKTLRPAIEDMAAAFPQEYGKRDFLSRLEACEKQAAETAAAMEENKEGAAERAGQLCVAIAAFQREALLANPLVSGQPLLFVMRPQYRSNYHAIDTLFHTCEANTGNFQGGGALKTIDLANGGAVKTLLDVPAGLARDPEVYFDGSKIVFAMRRNIQEDYHIYEIKIDGTGLRQLTRAPGVSDFDPLYLPDDSIVFSSTREPKYNMCSQDIAANLHRMDSDGANIHQIDRNNLFNNQASLLPDGRILYARWEYVDRNFGDAHALWTCNPDGTNHAIYWGNNTTVPGAAYTPRAIPGTSQVICVFGPHHDHLWGALAIVDRRLGLNGREPVVRTWPAAAINLVRVGGGFDCDAFSRVNPKYADPYPLSAKYFLCSRLTGHGEQMGIYLLDLFGNEILVHCEGPGCYDPMPLGPRIRPPVIPSRRDFESTEGYFLVADVYQGTHLKSVKRGTIKTLRVVESPEKRAWSEGRWFGQGYTAPGMNWHSLENKRILGVVPVEADGSAYFAVPAEKFVYFQLLDENDMMVQSMRSGAFVQPGEKQGCVGCHDERRAAPPAISGSAGVPPASVQASQAGQPVPHPTPLAFQRHPSKLAPWYGEPRSFGYTAEVQPVFNRHCVSCHDYGKEDGKKLNLAADRDLTFNTSYVELWRKGYTGAVGAGPAEVQPAYSWGSHASKLVQAVRKPHYDVKLSKEELDRIITWVDINAPYYATYTSAYPDSFTGRCPLDNKQLQRLSELTGVQLLHCNGFSSTPGVEVSFERPEVSPCLAKLSDKNDPKYKEALALIQAGKELLARRPRADMAGFQPCETDLRREEKYVSRRLVEQTNRAAIRDGRKVYDEAGVKPQTNADEHR